MLPAYMNRHRNIVRSPANPMDKSTIISIYPKDIKEVKPTMQPSTFEIKAGTYDNPSVLVVGSSSWWREIDENQPLLEIPVSSIVVAESVVKDYCNGILMCDMSTSMPGLSFLHGEHTVEVIKKEHKVLLDRAKERQQNWYKALVKLADVMWSRTNGNPISITDDSRLAARELNFLDKEWLKDSHIIELIRCAACGNLNNSKVIVCPNCKVILKPEEFKKLGLSFAS